jgi:glycosyltransferase involved in cell wall biosynthesis
MPEILNPPTEASAPGTYLIKQTTPIADQLTIVIPVYNEAGNLERLEKELLAFLKTAGIVTSILFVNDGSVDNSQEIIENICHRNHNFSYISFNRNYGLSAAIKAGFDHANSSLIGYMDADLQTTPEDFRLLLHELGDYDLVTGVRTERKDAFVKKMSSVMANKIRRAFTHDGMDDTGCPLKIIRAAAAKKIPMFRGLHRFLPAMILLQGGKIKQVPVRHFPRIAGKANFGLADRLLGPLSDCFAYLWMKKKYIAYDIAKKG